MRIRFPIPTALGLACVVSVGCLLTPIDAAAGTPVPAVPADAAADAPGPTVPLAITLTQSQWDELNLRRAVDLWLTGDVRGAAALLESVDVAPTSPFDRADRAAFLLAAAYLQMNDREAFRRVAERAGDENGSMYRRWIRFCALWESDIGGSVESPATGDRMEELPGANILAASILIEGGRYDKALNLLESSEPRGPLASIHEYLMAICRRAIGADPTRCWKQLANRKPKNGLEADLVGAALLELAAVRLETGKDADDLLARVPGESRFAPRAAHTRAVSAGESGDTQAERRILSEILAGHPNYDARRDVELALGGAEMERGDWAAALGYFQSAEAGWLDEYAWVSTLNGGGNADAWQTWEGQQMWRGEIRLAPEALFTELDRLVDRSLDLGNSPSPETDFAQALWPALDARNDSAATVWTRHYPSMEEWDTVRAMQSEIGRAQSELEKQERTVLERQRELRNRLDYLDRGSAKSTASAAELAGAAAALENILAHLDAELARLEAVRDGALLEIANRTREMAEQFRRDQLFIRALRHFHVEGPSSDRPDRFPAGVPSPARLLKMEEAMAIQSVDYLEFFAAHNDTVINRSFDQVWEPRLTGDSRFLHGAILDEIARARRIGAAVDSTMNWYASDPELAAAKARRDEVAAAVDSLRTREQTVRAEIAIAVALRGRERLERERESIDYHLADASYEMAVQRATDPATAEDTTVVALVRRRAIARVEKFLKRYPESFARGESRYRLADLRLMQARDDFQGKMAQFLGGDAPAPGDMNNRALAPFVDYAPVVALYEAILAKDGDFPHMDAVLFNLGMILSDDGRPEASDHLARLVEDYPDSPDCQEAWLRMAGDRFDRKQFAASVPMFEEAAAGNDSSFAAIALYKLGWAQFEEDRFRDSADAFRRLMDLYMGNDRLAAKMDLRDEAEQYLVHSLARAGGADAFRDYFDGLGGRVYESRVLMSLGHLTRSVSLFEEAAACDRLWLERYPLNPNSLTVAQRLVDTYHNWNKPDAARATKLSLAANYLPDGQWFQANGDPQLRAAAAKFAQSAYRETAAYHHRQARETNDRGSWRLALDNYSRYLDYWPDDSDRYRMQFFAGDAAAHLDNFALAAAQFLAAAESDSAALALDASWQHVAVVDSWYRRSLPPGEGATGADSLAVKLLAAGDRFTARFPGDERCPDVVWRQGNVAYAHGWFADAGKMFDRLSERYPTDSRAVLAVRMSGDAHYKRSDYEAAGAAYERALLRARAAGADSVVVGLEATVPLCYYKHAESVAAADTVSGEKQAAHLFERVGSRWPGFEHADLALYRAGLGYAAAGSHADAAGAWEALLATYPKSDYTRDGAIQIAMVHEQSGNTRSAAGAYERFSRLHPDDPDAPEALLKSADLLAAAGDDAGARRMKTVFLDRFPGDVETAMEIRADRAVRELAGVTEGGSTLASLLSAGDASSSELKAYLALAAANPNLASARILAQVDFIEAEEAHPAYASIRLTRPLPKSIEKKKQKMEGLLKLYDGCARHGVSEYSRAAAHRIGQVLIEFGDALAESERPSGLNEDDLLAYEDVLEEQSWEFFDRGEDAWSELLQQVGDAPEDPGGWLARTREALWPRLAWRFLYRPELEYPLVAATPPAESEAN